MDTIRIFCAIARRLVAKRSNFATPANQPPAVLARPRVAVRAKPLATKRWQEKRWTCHAGLLPGGIPGAEYSGFYQTAGGRKYQGLIVETQQAIAPFIVNPPLDDIRIYTGHDQCFRPRGNGTYFVHLTNAPGSVDEAIVNIEVLLNEVEQRAGWRRVPSRAVVTAVARPMEFR